MPLALFTFRAFRPSYKQKGPVVADQLSFDVDTCSSFYMDMGTNVGIQIRKLYEPDLFPDSGILPYYDKYFADVGTRRAGVCTFGFEPNPNHTTRLESLQETYKSKGWKVHIFHAGVGPKEGTFTFETDGDARNDEWGAKVALDDSKPIVYGTTTHAVG
jgi:hypothetical protein